MTTSTVIASPARAVDEMLRSSARGRCACCGGPTLPVLEWRGDHALCNRCARHCEAKGGKHSHVIPARLDWAAADRAWAVDLGFKKLGQ
ncbi:MAG TPA: hypothetical protein VIK33_06930 [Anaerolineae bacterium]